ncbi:hypothetical protein BOTBODRAFT_280620 [Botryobasidium botryosum FD-172 SS1]|uniref:Uncharacterized protein n=1 Tax=Botryobasidium botryosum (strain FD-172 SS1) TaxID=930990 RepID=A0A067MUI7_BOTB1|nr:hypothetical protein BOTBODRAFT_280620 [Botryobasidium botryosum FD-172 SS1]
MHADNPLVSQVPSETQGRRAAAKKTIAKDTPYIPKPLDAYGGTSVKNLFAIDFCASHPGATKEEVNNAFDEINDEDLKVYLLHLFA